MLSLAVDLSPVFAVLVLLLTLVFTVKPVPKFGLLNLLFGCFDLLIGALTGAGVGMLPFHPYFSLLIALVGTLCIWRGTKAGELSE